jgi:hypothetical protein
MSISQNFPDEGPSLNLNFASSRILDPRITFTRTSTGTYTDKNGLVTIASANTPRFDHSYDGSNVQSLGLLIEESRTNLITYSGISSSFWSTNNSAVVTNNSSTSPDGTTNATQIAGAALIHSGIFRTLSLTSGTIYTYSLFVKAVSGSNTIYFGTDTGTNTKVQVNTSTGVASLNSGSPTNITSTAYPNGWYRIAFTFTASATATHSFVIYNLTANLNTWLAWGAQVEAGSFATSYIPTVASTVTRSADNASMTGINFSSWYNSTASTGGTILAQARRGYSGNFSGYPNLYTINDGTSNNRIIVYGVDASTQFTNYAINTGGVLQTDYVFANISTTNLFKSIHTFATNSSTFCVNGTLTTTDTSVTIPSVNRLNIGQNESGGNPWNGTISAISYYPTRLSNTLLQNLTK